jgi:protocatechuate 3,4-dioxygenase beta subunit
MQDDSHDHDKGLAHDLPRMIGRRRMLALTAGVLAAGGGLWLSRGLAGEQVLSASGADGLVCVKPPAETAGPYPADGTNVRDGQTVNALAESGVQRVDMRPSFDPYKGGVDGVALDLTLTLVDVNAACAPLAGLAIYLWHCDTAGQYSLYDVPDQNWLRAVGVTDAAGQVRFTTIFPGCYDGRYPHMHFEIFASPKAAISGKASLLTAQLAMPEAACKTVYADARYGGSLDRLARSGLARDMVFSDNAPEQLAAQTLTITGDPASRLAGSVTVGLA